MPCLNKAVTAAAHCVCVSMGFLLILWEPESVYTVLKQCGDSPLWGTKCKSITTLLLVRLGLQLWLRLGKGERRSSTKVGKLNNSSFGKITAYSTRYP